MNSAFRLIQSPNNVRKTQVLVSSPISAPFALSSMLVRLSPGGGKPFLAASVYGLLG